jgi:hypothetical protein
MIIPRTALFAILLAIVLIFCTATAPAANAEKEWTVMFYMNGKNNLEPDALDNFHSMAEVGSSDGVNFVVELGRPRRPGYTRVDGNWSGVYRFYLKKGTSPLPKEAAFDVRKADESVDMGKPEALAHFVDWAKREYPAHRYMLVIWNHGQGWRFQLSTDRNLRMESSRGVSPPTTTSSRSTPAPALGGFRAVSSDEDTGSILFNREIQDIIANEFGSQRLNVLGFDACLMSMAETAYAFAPHVNVLVASEELEPAAGWRYSKWMDKLVANPEMTDAQLGSALVEMYRNQYENEYLTTLSATDLNQLRETMSQLSVFANAIRDAGKDEVTNLRQARMELTSYGASLSRPPRTSVDLLGLLRHYELRTKNAKLRSQSVALRDLLAHNIITNYASTRSAAPDTRQPYGSEGIAIYFPESRQAFLADRFHEGYSKANSDRPVDFVKNETWVDLLDLTLKEN